MHNYNSQGQLLTLNIFAQSSITLTQGWTGLHICSWATTGTFILYAKLKTELPNMRTEARNHHLKISWVSLDQHCHERSELWGGEWPAISFVPVKSFTNRWASTPKHRAKHTAVFHTLAKSGTSTIFHYFF